MRSLHTLHKVHIVDEKMFGKPKLTIHILTAVEAL